MDKNPFSKEKALSNVSINPDTNPDIDVSTLNISDDTKRCLEFLSNKKNGITCTKDEIQQLNSLINRDDKIQWMKEKMYQSTLNTVNESVSHTLDEADVFKTIKNPLEINPDDLESIMSFKTDEQQKAELAEVLSKARNQLRDTLTSDYISKRNRRRSDGTIDEFVSIDELREIDRQVETELKNAQFGRTGVRDAAKLSGVINTLNDMSVESRYAYEGYKEGVCNDFGVTPESFDEWFAAVQNENMKRLDEDGINIRTDLYNVKEFLIKHKGLLRKVPGWKKGDIVYISEFNAKVRELEAKEMEESAKNATPEGKQLFQEMVTDTFHSPDNPVKLKKSLVSKDETKTFLRKRASRNKPLTIKPEDKPDVNKSEHKHNPIVTLDNLLSEEPKEVALSGPMEMIDSPDAVPMGERWNEQTGMIEKVPISEIFKHQEESKVELNIDRELHENSKELATEEVKEVVNIITEEDPYVKKYLQMGLSREQAELLADKDKEKDVSDVDKKINSYIAMGLNEEQAKLLVNADIAKSEPVKVVVEPKKYVEPKTENHVEEVVKEKKSRYDGTRGNIDDYCKVIESEADPSILRSTSNRLDAIRRYKDSAKRGRLLFLPNSNYEVYIKKIRSTESIGYMITLLNNMKDMNMVDAYVKSEILRILYENIEFDFPEAVSYDDFIRCLHESDMTLLMIMLALVNIPETKDGKVPLTIKSLLCSNPDCGAIGNLKEDMTLDLKEEFTRIYPVELYATNYAAYKNANYPTIYHAYRDSQVGKMERYVIKDDMFEFNCICSAPTVYKTQAIKGSRDEVTYRRLVERIGERVELYKAAGDVYADVKDYLDFHTYQDYAKDLADISMEVVDVDTKTKAVMTAIADEMDSIKKEDLPFYLVMDVIDQLTITTLDGEEVVNKLDQKDVFTLLGILAKDAPKALLDKIIETKNSSLDKSFPVDIEFEAEEVAGLFDFDGYYGTDEEMVAEIRRRYESIPDVKEEDIQKVVDAQRVIRNEHKPLYEEEAKCFCGNNKWKLNYTAILFFWTSNLSQTLLK